MTCSQFTFVCMYVCIYAYMYIYHILLGMGSGTCAQASYTHGHIDTCKCLVRSMNGTELSPCGRAESGSKELLPQNAREESSRHR